MKSALASALAALAAVSPGMSYEEFSAVVAEIEAEFGVSFEASAEALS